ncbi:MAG: hypothetical protein MUO26_02010 [Methanotrichaceae archaeon]|nr:hypothetical protein [Methanotrichaceae archaeon]
MDSAQIESSMIDAISITVNFILLHHNFELFDQIIFIICFTNLLVEKYRLIMPELPEAEILRRYLEANSLHKGIRRLDIRDRRILENISTKRLKKNREG